MERCWRSRRRLLSRPANASAGQILSQPFLRTILSHSTSLNCSTVIQRRVSFALSPFKHSRSHSSARDCCTSSLRATCNFCSAVQRRKKETLCPFRALMLHPARVQLPKIPHILFGFLSLDKHFLPVKQNISLKQIP